jgi:hypothetical protein
MKLYFLKNVTISASHKIFEFCLERLILSWLREKKLSLLNMNLIPERKLSNFNGTLWKPLLQKSRVGGDGKLC